MKQVGYVKIGELSKYRRSLMNAHVSKARAVMIDIPAIRDGSLHEAVGRTCL
jgi:hypothetical protein